MGSYISGHGNQYQIKFIAAGDNPIVHAWKDQPDVKKDKPDTPYCVISTDVFALRVNIVCNCGKRGNNQIIPLKLGFGKQFVQRVGNLPILQNGN
jgi:hypothetical protein